MRGIEHVPWLYDGLMALVDPLGLRPWRRELLRGVQGRAFEVGCGTGRNLPLYPAGAPPFAADRDLRLLATARRRAPAARLLAASAEALPFRDGCFATVVSSLVFCGVGDPAGGLAELRRLLAVGGELRMLEHVRARGRLKAWLQDRVQPAWTWLAGGCHPNRDTEAAVEAAGFAIERRTYRASGDLRLFVARVGGGGDGNRAAHRGIRSPPY